MNRQPSGYVVNAILESGRVPRPDDHAPELRVARCASPISRPDPGNHSGDTREASATGAFHVDLRQTGVASWLILDMWVSVEGSTDREPPLRSNTTEPAQCLDCKGAG